MMKRRALCLAVAAVLLAPHAIAQWVQSYGPLFSSVRCFQADGTNLFAGTFGGGVLLSTDNGISWETRNFGLTFGDVRSLVMWRTNLFAATGGGIFRSADSGATWIGIDSGLTNANVQAFAVIETSLFAGTGDGVFVTVDSGAFWAPVDSGLTNTNVVALAVMGTNLFAGTGEGVFLSADRGTSWAQTGFRTSVNALAVSGTSLFAGTGSWAPGGSVFRTVDSGATWTEVPSGLSNTSIQAFAVLGENIFAGGSWAGGGGVYLSTDSGDHWAHVDSGLTDRDVTSLGCSGTDLFAGTVIGGIWRRPLSEIVTSVDINRREVPGQFDLGQNYPNPFNPSTSIRYVLPIRSPVKLAVFNALGQEVRTLFEGEQEAGYHEVKFDGGGLSSGVYFYRLHAHFSSPPGGGPGDFVRTRRLVLLR